MKKTEDSAYEPVDGLMVLGVPARTLTSEDFEKYAKVHGRNVMLKAFRPVRKSFNNVKTEEKDGSVQPEKVTGRQADRV